MATSRRKVPLSEFIPSSREVSRRMSQVRTVGTSPEMKIRSRLHAMGLRYRVDRRPERDVNSRADIVFGPAKVAVYVDGCFWHGCPEHGSLPRANRERWRAKLDRNRERDDAVRVSLENTGWKVIRVWEHEDPRRAADRITRAVLRRLPERQAAS